MTWEGSEDRADWRPVAGRAAGRDPGAEREGPGKARDGQVCFLCASQASGAQDCTQRYEQIKIQSFNSILIKIIP